MLQFLAEQAAVALAVVLPTDKVPILGGDGTRRPALGLSSPLDCRPAPGLHNEQVAGRWLFERELAVLWATVWAPQRTVPRRAGRSVFRRRAPYGRSTRAQRGQHREADLWISVAPAALSAHGSWTPRAGVLSGVVDTCI